MRLPEQNWRRQLIYYLALLVLASIIWFPFHIYSAAVSKRLKLELDSVLSRSGYPGEVLIEGFVLRSPLAFSIESLTFPFQGEVIEFKSVRGSLNLLSLLLLEVSGTLDAKLYSSNIRVTISRSIFSNPQVLLETTQLSLGEIRHLRRLGISGDVSGTALVELLDIEYQRFRSELDIKLSSGRYSGGHRVQIINLPPVGKIELSLKARLKGEVGQDFYLELPEIIASSDFVAVSASGNARIIKPRGLRGNYRVDPFGTGEIKFLQDPEESKDSKTMIGFMALATGSQDLSKLWSVQNWQFSFEGVNSQGLPKFKTKSLD